MKKLILIVLLAPVIAFAQKAPKPNTNKILSLLQDGKYKEAKEQADITVADAKLSTEGKAWYYRGLVYMSLDTVKDASVKALDPNALDVALESFKKAEQLNKKDNEYNIIPAGTIMPVTKTVQITTWANTHLSRSIDLMQNDEPDYSASYAEGGLARKIFENTLIRYENDTLTYYIQSLAAVNMERYDSAIEAGNKYIEKGGKSSDIYLILFQAYYTKEDQANALKIAQEARKKYPHKEDFVKNELNAYLNLKQYDEAKSMVEQLISTKPSAEYYYLLGELNRELKNTPEAEKAYRKGIELDPNHYDSNAALAELTYAEVGEVRSQRDATKDTGKRQQLYMKIEQELKESVIYWERLEALKPNEDNVLYGLQSIYNDLSVYDEAKYTPKLNKLKAKMKALGLEVD